MCVCVCVCVWRGQLVVSNFIQLPLAPLPPFLNLTSKQQQEQQQQQKQQQQCYISDLKMTRFIRVLWVLL